MAVAAAPPRPSASFEFGDPAPNAVGRKALVPHDDCIVHLEADSADRLLWYGEDLIRVKLPAGTRVVYPKPAIPGLADRDAAIRYAVDHPEQGRAASGAASRRDESHHRHRRHLAAAAQDVQAGHPRVRAQGFA